MPMLCVERMRLCVVNVWRENFKTHLARKRLNSGIYIKRMMRIAY